MTLDDVRALLRRRINDYKGQRGIGLRAWCREHGVTASRASEFLSEKRGPTSDLLSALDLEWQVALKKKEPQADAYEECEKIAGSVPTSMSVFLTRQEATAATETKKTIISAIRAARYSNAPLSTDPAVDEKRALSTACLNPSPVSLNEEVGSHV